MQLTALFRLMGGDGIPMDYNGIRKLSRQQSIQNAAKQYDPKKHDVALKSKRPDKIIFVPNGQKDPITGADILVQDFSPVSRAPVAFEDYIINQKSAFAAGSGVVLKPSKPNTELYEYVTRNWSDNKTDYQLQDIFRQCMGYTQSAVIFYGEQGAESFDEFRYKFKIVSPEKGDKLEPFFDDDTGDLVAFGREYMIEDKTRYDFYVKIGQFVEIHRFEGGSPFMWVGIDTENPSNVFVTTYTKLPIVYFSQDTPECDITSELTHEFEQGFNEFLTQMGYTGDPILFGKGTTINLPAKGQPGKFIEGSADSDLKFITPDNATESRELSFKYLQKYIFGLNRAVFLDMETMKELGDVSGAALERYLLSVYMEATGKQQGYLGMGVQRMVNWLLHTWRELAGGDKDLRIYVEFQRYSVSNEMDRVELAMKANGGKAVITHRDSIAMAGLTDDVEGSLAEIEAASPQPVPAPAE